MGEYTKLVEETLKEGIFSNDKFNKFKKYLGILLDNGWVIDPKNSDVRMKTIIALSNKQYKYASIEVTFEKGKPTVVSSFWTEKGKGSSEQSYIKVNGEITTTQLSWIKKECEEIEKIFKDNY